MLEALADNVYAGCKGDALVLADAAVRVGDGEPEPRVVGTVAGGDQHGADALAGEVHRTGRRR